MSWILERAVEIALVGKVKKVEEEEVGDNKPTQWRRKVERETKVSRSLVIV